jgi:hypothetical protein
VKKLDKIGKVPYNKSIKKVKKGILKMKKVENVNDLVVALKNVKTVDELQNLMQNHLSSAMLTEVHTAMQKLGLKIVDNQKYTSDFLAKVSNDESRSLAEKMVLLRAISCDYSGGYEYALIDKNVKINQKALTYYGSINDENAHVIEGNLVNYRIKNYINDIMYKIGTTNLIDDGVDDI